MIGRRALLRSGTAGLVGFSLASGLISRRSRAEGQPRTGKATACILLYMEGGPSQLDTWDPKPGRATGGTFSAIESAVSGVRVSEHLPSLAKQMQRLALLRTVTCKEGNHERARHLMHTGYAPQTGAAHPALGSLVAQARGVRELPGYVSIGGPGEDAGLLGAAWAPFPVREAGKPVQGLEPPKEIDQIRFSRRLELRRIFDASFASTHASAIVEGQRAVGEQAATMMRSPAVQAFRLEQEPQPVRDAYGDTPFGKGCLLARRLVEAGVPFVEVTQKGWDTHQDNFTKVAVLSADLDRGMGALLDDLAARGLLDTTLVVWMGDFGRTPAINKDTGRDHFPKISSVVLAGGGLRGGQVVGETDADGMEIRNRPVAVPDLFRTLAYALGLDPEEMRESPAGRPIRTVDGGEIIRELI